MANNFTNIVSDEDYYQDAQKAISAGIRASERIAGDLFLQFKAEINLRGLEENVFKKYYDEHLGKCEEKRKENDFYNKFFQVREIHNESGAFGGHLHKSVIEFQRKTKLGWDKVAVELAYSLAHARLIEMLNDWKLENWDNWKDIFEKFHSQDYEASNETMEKIRHEGKAEEWNFSHKQIAIVCFVMDVRLTRKNGVIYLKYSRNKSVDKLLQKRITSNNQLTALGNTKSASTKNRNDLHAAQELVRIIGDDTAQQKIANILIEYTHKYENYY